MHPPMLPNLCFLCGCGHWRGSKETSSAESVPDAAMLWFVLGLGGGMCAAGAEVTSLPCTKELGVPKQHTAHFTSQPWFPPWQTGEITTVFHSGDEMRGCIKNTWRGVQQENRFREGSGVSLSLKEAICLCYSVPVKLHGLNHLCFG